MKRWWLASGSELGSRPSNDDAVRAVTWTCRRSRYLAVVASDGVGSLQGSGACARETMACAISAARRFVRTRRKRGRFAQIDRVRLREAITLGLRKLSGSPSHSCTLAIAVFGPVNGLVAWAGDSRIYVLFLSGALREKTSDHRNTEGLITCYVRGDGIICGALDCHVIDTRRSVAVCATTDGVHDCCSHAELRQFLGYCMTLRTVELTSDIGAFLKENPADNASIAIAYSKLSNRRVAAIINSRR